MTPLLGPARAFALAERDLTATQHRLETMHAEAWYPKQPDHDRPTPHRPAGAAPDFVAGAPRDCGLGDEQARQGWARMVAHLHAAEQTATDVLCASVGCDSRCVPASRPTSLLDAQARIRRLQERVTALQRLWEVWAGQGPTILDTAKARWLTRQLAPPFEHIRRAALEAQGVVREVGTGQPPAVCPKCRRLGSIGQPRKGGLCFACDKQNTRYGRRQRQTTVRAWKRANR